MNYVWSYLCIIFGTVINVSCSNETPYFFFTKTINNTIVVTGSESQLNVNDVPEWTVQAFYNASQNNTGWDILELWSNPAMDDAKQAYHAGYLEGYITRQQIWNFFYNNIEFVTSNKSNVANKIFNDYFNDNNKYVKNMVASNKNDPFWYQVDLVYQQLYGLIDGYNNATHGQNMTDQILTENNFFLITFLEELSDILTAYNVAHHKPSNKNDSHGANNHNKTSGKTGAANQFSEHNNAGAHCSALIKVLPGNADVFIGHNTWTTYGQMNRILKRYKLPFKVSKTSSSIIPGMSTTFSSYPGSIESVDDFYVMNSGIVTMETTNNLYNRSMFKDIHSKGQILEEVRNVVANRLATNGSMWMDIFKNKNSGTYNNQWMVIDLNKFRPGFDPQEGFLSVLEQAPGLIVQDDQTQHILKNGYWASYNIPFYKEMYDRTGNFEAAKNDSSNSYSECPRAKIFRREQSKVIDLTSMMWLMRYNDYKTDPYSICDKCNPKQDACNAIASRCDLNPASGNKSNGLNSDLFGAIDAKVTSFSLFSEGKLLAVGGPTTSRVPPFSWNNVPNKDSIRHLGQPDKWDFSPITTSWILPYTTLSDNNSGTTDLPPNTNKTNSKKKTNSSPTTKPFSLFAYISVVAYIVFKF